MTSPRRPAPREDEGQAIEIRCDCGSLLARWTDTGLESKCRRCKRQVVVQIDSAGRAPPGARKSISAKGWVDAPAEEC